MLLDPKTGIIMFIVGGIGAVVLRTAYKFADKIGQSDISMADLLPAPPPQAPLPRLIYKLTS